MLKAAFMAPDLNFADAAGQSSGLNSLISGNKTVSTQNPMSPYAEDKIDLTPQQWLSTYDQEFKKKNPVYAALNKYYNPYQSSQSLGYSVGQGLHKLRSGSVGNAVGKTLNQGPLIGGLASAIPGLLAGGLGTGLFNMITGQDATHNMGRNALMGGALTGGLGAFSGYLRKYKPDFTSPSYPAPMGYDELMRMKMSERERVADMLASKNASIRKAAFSSGGSMPQSEAKSRILTLIQNAPGLSFNERSQLISGVALLSGPDLGQLASSLSGVIGASAGAIIARFLMNKGLIGTVIGAIFGGTIAKAIFGHVSPTNFLGQRSTQGKDITGEYL